MTAFLVTALLAATPAVDSARTTPPGGHVLSCGSTRIDLAPGGAMRSFGDGRRLSGITPDGAGALRYGGRAYALDKPTRSGQSEATATFEYELPAQPPLRVSIEYRLASQDRATIIARQITLQSDKPLTDDLTVSINLAPWMISSDTWLPLKNGTAGRLAPTGNAAYRLAGKLPADGAALAMPLVTTPGHEPPQRVTHVTDIYYSSLFTSTTVEWTYPRAVGLEGGRERRMVATILHEGDEEQAIDLFYKAALPDIAPGPTWLHDIAMVDYDYMSDAGQGWFRDIDAMCEALPRAERSKVFLCLHGWFDHVGRYCFDPVARKLDREWTVFSNYENVKAFAYDLTLDGVPIKAGFPNCKPLRMTLDDVHKRIACARERGFRVGLYYASGIESSDSLPHYTPDRVLSWGGWTGPDTEGKTFIENPLMPAVYSFYLDYTDALLAEFGGEIDSLVWDVTTFIGAGHLGGKDRPGYADRAMMRLMRDVTVKVQEFNKAHERQIAMLASDMIGAWGPPVQPPYCLAAHGTYQDSHCRPEGNGPEIFPNYRNVVWLCNWWPVVNWRPAEFAVRHYQAPVPISNGWGDDVGFAEMTPAQRTAVLNLFNLRKQYRTKLKWFDALPAFTPARTATRPATNPIGN